jgi:hypothetical protein
MMYARASDTHLGPCPLDKKERMMPVKTCIARECPHLGHGYDEVGCEIAICEIFDKVYRTPMVGTEIMRR